VAGVIASTAFVLSPYFLFIDPLMRGDLAEFLALSLLPWVFYVSIGRSTSRSPSRDLGGLHFQSQSIGVDRYGAAGDVSVARLVCRWITALGI
jgi:hypothetical protein